MVLGTDERSRGDTLNLRRISLDQALRSATKVISSGTRMTWDFIQWNAPPKVMWARLAPLDLQGRKQVAQVCAKFDAQQVRTALSSPLSLEGYRADWRGSVE